jgi:integrase
MPIKNGNSFWTWVRRADGSRIRVPLGTADKATAKRAEQVLARLAAKWEWDLLEAVISRRLSVSDLVAAQEAGPRALTEARTNLTDPDISSYITAWQEWAGRSTAPGTVARYLRQVRAVMPEGKPFPRSRFTRATLSAALSQLEIRRRKQMVKGCDSTARRYHAAWSSLATFLVEREVIDTNPLRSVKAPRANPAKEAQLELADTLRLVDAQQGIYRALLALCEGSGAEISPALAIRRRDLDEKAQTVHVHGTKTAARDRIIRVEDWAWPIVLTAARGKMPDALLFTEDGAPASYYNARKHHRAAVKRLGLPADYTLHCARHSLAVRWSKAGVEPQLIANQLGHEDILMVVRVYGKYRPKAGDLERARSGTHD